MKVLTDQTVYQCEGCGKRFLTKQGADKHERKYCREHPESNKNPKNCPHENIETKYVFFDGHPEPDYDFCVDCGEQFY